MARLLDAPAGAWALLAVAVLAVSSGGVVLQEMGQVPPFLRASWRMQGTALVLLPGFAFQVYKADLRVVTRNDCLIALASSAFLAMHFGSWVWSLDNTSLVHSLLFVNTHPLVVVALMPAMGKLVSRTHIFGVVIGFTGAAIALLEVGGGGEASLAGDAAAFLGAVTVVGYLLAGRHLRSERGMPIFIYAFPVTLGAGVWLTVYSVMVEGTAISQAPVEESILGWSDSAWLAWVAFLSLGPGLCGHTGINTVLRWISPIVVSISMLFEPVLGAAIAWAWTGEAEMGPYTVLGGALMIAGAILVTIKENEQNRSKSVS
ncbi:MAG: hypothetical protein CMA88_03555 [Euryarchaeota archaeon]|nr:hypothetical protein [Euryarchaeota archaeon]